MYYHIIMILSVLYQVKVSLMCSLNNTLSNLMFFALLIWSYIKLVFISPT